MVLPHPSVFQFKMGITVYVQLSASFFIKASPYDACILHFLDPFFVNVAGDVAL